MPQIGAKIKMLRKTRRLTLKQVADAVGMTPGYLSQLESGRVGASFSTLLKLAHYFGQNLSELVGVFEDGHKPLVSRPSSRVSVISQEQFTLEWLIADPTCRMEVDLMTVKPGGCSGGTYSHGGEEFCFILEGSLSVVVGDAQYLLGEGDLLYFSSEIPHSWANEGSGQSRVLWCTTPPTV